jgi:hypothetical protein
MAGQITHIIAGEEAFLRAARLSEPETRGIAALGGAACGFRLGCQGPDIFYHNQRTMPSGLRYGSLAHRRGYGSLVAAFAEALPRAARRPDDPAGAYLLGLATHAALDRATHPFIVYFAGWADPSLPETASRRGCHPFLERVLDLALLRRARGIDASEYDIASLMAEPARGDADLALAQLWARALRAAYPRQAAEDALLERRAANALADARFFYEITNPAADLPGAGRDRWAAFASEAEGLRHVALLYPREQPAGTDAANEAHERWEHPAGDGRSSEASYYDLVEEGAAEAAGAISSILEAWRSRDDGDSAAKVAAAIGDGSLSVSDLEGRAAAPRLSRPLPLPAAMEAEYRRRAAGR